VNTNTLTVALVVVIVPLVIRWLSRGSAATASPGKLAYASRHKAFALAFLVIPPVLVGALAVAAPPRKPGDVIAFAAIILLFAGLSLPLVIEFYRVSISFDDVGIHVSSPWSRRRTLRWDEVRVIRWRNVTKWLDLRTERSVVHISPWLVGLEAFGVACETHLPVDVVSRDAEAACVLALMKQGRAGELVWANQPPSSLV
jgi:hypothetical protein